MKKLNADDEQLNYDLYYYFFNGSKNDETVKVKYKLELNGKILDKVIIYKNKNDFTDSFFKSTNPMIYSSAIKDDNIILESEDVMITISKNDIKNYDETHKIKHNKLKLAENELFEKEIPLFDIDTYQRTIAVAVCDRNKKIMSVETKIIKYNEDQIRVELNKLLIKYYKEVSNNTLRINLKYKVGDEELSYKWKTIDELSNEGVIKLL